MAANSNVSTEYKTVEKEKNACTSGSVKQWLRSANFLVYCTHFLITWGDRMWHFGMALFLVAISPGSLQLSAIYGLSTGGATLLFGACIGRWIDRNPRLKVARATIVFRNLSALGCAALVSLLIVFRDWANAFWDGWLVWIWQVAIVTVAVLVNLSSIGTRICIQKDWIVEICARDTDKLATMTAVLRRIDLATKILAPIILGQIMTFASMLAGAIFIAGWNLLTIFIEYLLLRKVFVRVPALSSKEKNKNVGVTLDKTVQVEVQTSIDVKTDVKTLPGSVNSDFKHQTVTAHAAMEDNPTVHQSTEEEFSQTHSVLAIESLNMASPKESDQKLAKPMKRSADEKLTFVTYKCDKTALDSRSACCNGDGCSYKGFGPITVFINGWRTYIKYEVAIAGFALALLYLTVLGFDNITTGFAYSQGLSESLLGFLMGAGALIGIVGTFCYTRIRRRVGLDRTGLVSFTCQILCITLCVGSIWAPGSPFDPLNWRENRKLNAKLVPCNTSTTPALETVTPPDWLANASQSGDGIDNSTLVLCAQENYGVKIPDSYFSIVMLMTGILTARFGLWITDLVVSQLMLEKVKETERGVVNGVQTSLNQFLNMVKYALVVAAPQPELFGLLILISFTAVSSGGVFYAAYSRKVRGHLIHPEKLCCKKNSYNPTTVKETKSDLS